MREVAGCLGVAMSTATQLADRLEGLGLVERRADPTDRRVVRLALTERGEAALSELHRQRDERITTAMERLSPEDRRAVLTGLELLERAAQDVAPPPSGPHPLWEVVTGASLPEAGSQDAVQGRHR